MLTAVLNFLRVDQLQCIIMLTAKPNCSDGGAELVASNGFSLDLTSRGSASCQDGSHAAALLASDAPSAAPACPAQPPSDPAFSAIALTKQADAASLTPQYQTDDPEGSGAIKALSVQASAGGVATNAATLPSTAASTKAGTAVAAPSSAGQRGLDITMPDSSSWGPCDRWPPDTWALWNSAAAKYKQCHGYEPELPVEDTCSARSSSSGVDYSPYAPKRVAAVTDTYDEPACEVAACAAASGESLHAAEPDAHAVVCVEVFTAAPVAPLALEAVSAAALTPPESLPQYLRVSSFGRALTSPSVLR
jgi:hypothetical protein